jgi:hypothetical protein
VEQRPDQGARVVDRDVEVCPPSRHLAEERGDHRGHPDGEDAAPQEEDLHPPGPPVGDQGHHGHEDTDHRDEERVGERKQPARLEEQGPVNGERDDPDKNNENSDGEETKEQSELLFSPELSP